MDPTDPWEDGPGVGFVDGSMVNGSMGYNLPTYKWDMYIYIYILGL